MNGCSKDCLILIPFRLSQISCFTPSLKCFSSESDSCPTVGIRLLLQFPHLPRPGPVLLTLLFFPLVSPSYLVLLGYIFFSTGQVPLSTLSWCSACTSVSEGVFLMYPWREIYSMSTYSSDVLFSSLQGEYLKDCKHFKWTVNFQMFKLVLEKVEEPEIKLPTSVVSSKKQEGSRKHLFMLYWLCQSLWLCGSQETVENSERDGNNRPPGLPPKKPICRSGSTSCNWTWNNRMVPNRKRGTSRLYIATLLI